MLKNLVILARPKHYLKNGLVLLPLLFSGKLFEDGNLIRALIAAAAFSLLASAVYIINDIQDVENDRKHPKKKLRPLASGTVSSRQAGIFAALLAIGAAGLCFTLHISYGAWALLGAYAILNIAYSAGLKNIPVLDITILAIGFVLRVLYGGQVVDIEVSRWLYLTVLAGAFYMGLGKRRGELRTNGTKSRKVNEFYTHNFLDKNVYVCQALTLVFYSLWATDPTKNTRSLFWTIPIIIVLLMTYSLDLEQEKSMGDPVDVLLGNKLLALLALTYIAFTCCLIYI